MKRYRILDHIRGVTLLSMIVYHAIWDLVYIFDMRLDWYKTEIGYAWQQSICWTFILLSGFCWNMSKNKVKRGLVVFSAGFVITMVTLFLMPENRVLFGVLTLLGVCMLMQNLLESFYGRCNCAIGIVLAFISFLLLKNINSGWIGVATWKIVGVPESWYANLVTAFLGFPFKNFFSTDYFSLFPWYFLFLTGYFLYRFMQKNGLLQKLPDVHIAPLEWIGKHSLLLYLLHQPVIYGVLNLMLQT